MAVQTVNSAIRPGIDLTALAVAADAGLSDSWLNSGAELVAVVNGGGSSITVTENYVATTRFDVNVTPTSQTYTVPAGHTAILGPFRTDYFNDATGKASITYSAVTSVKVCVFKPGAA